MTPPPMFHNAGGATPAQVLAMLDSGAIAVRYRYVVSIVLVTLEFESSPFLLRDSDSRYAWSIPYVVLSLLLGWWGLPWGPFQTVRSVWSNLHGGEDVTEEAVSALETWLATQPMTMPAR